VKLTTRLLGGTSGRQPVAREGGALDGQGRIAEPVLDFVVTGMNLSPGRLRDQLDEEPTLFVFLRHFGCMFCREAIADIRAATESDPWFPRTLFFFQGTPTEGRAFLRRYWPGVRAVADPTAELYAAFGIERGGLAKNLGPKVWQARRRALDKGHRNGRRSGDVWRMPGVMLTRGDRIHWAHDVRHAADHPDLAEVARVNRALIEGARPESTT
jgi:hypothetical protein